MKRETRPIVARRRLAFAIDRLPKAALIDCLATVAIRVARSRGIEKPTDDEVAAILQPMVNGVTLARGDVVVDLKEAMRSLDATDQRYFTGPNA